MSGLVYEDVGEHCFNLVHTGHGDLTLERIARVAELFDTREIAVTSTDVEYCPGGSYAEHTLVVTGATVRS